MRGLSKYNGLFLILATVLIFGSCVKEQIAPPNQELAFLKYYGHVADQDASDVKRTADGGYILIGSTNSYAQSNRREMMLIKTDEFGNEQWSRSYCDPNGITLNNDSYHQEGVRVVILPDDAGYVIAGNRTYINSGKTKIVLYRVGLNGEPDLGPIVLRNVGPSYEPFSELLADIKLDFDSIAGVNNYVLTGSTTNVWKGKPGGYFPQYDLTDILTLSLDENLSIKSLWQNTPPRGFKGEDTGIDVHVLGNNYLVVGTDQQDANGLKDNLRLILFEKNSAGLVNTRSVGDNTWVFKGGYAVINETTQRILVVGSLEDNGKGKELVLCELYTNLVPTSTSANKFITLDLGDYNAGTDLEAAGIAIVPNNDGYVISLTSNKTNLDSDILILRLDRDLNRVEGWPFVSGYHDPTNITGTPDKAGPVLPVTELIEGTTQYAVTGYAFTGTFGLGTNEMIGLAKLNANGKFEPQ